jgi:hypothetical protein
VCEAVFGALLGESRAEGAARVDSVALGWVLGLGPVPGGQNDRLKFPAPATLETWVADAAGDRCWLCWPNRRPRWPVSCAG